MEDPKKRKAKRLAKKNAIKGMATDSYKKSDAGNAKNKASELKKAKDVEEVAKNNIKKTGYSGYASSSRVGELSQAQQAYDKARQKEAANMVGAEVRNTMVGSQVRAAPIKLDSGTKKQVKGSLKEAAKNKNRSKQAVQSDKKRIRAYNAGR